MLNDFLSKSYEPASSSDATFLIDELYRQIMCDAFSKLSGKVLARRLCTLYTFLCTAERTSASIVAALVRMVMMKLQGQFCAISMLCFIPKMIECFGIMLPSPTSFLLKHGQTSALITRTLHFRVTNQPTTVSLANLASVS
jgi:hypothetical protein